MDRLTKATNVLLISGGGPGPGTLAFGALLPAAIKALAVSLTISRTYVAPAAARLPETAQEA